MQLVLPKPERTAGRKKKKKSHQIFPVSKRSRSMKKPPHYLRTYRFFNFLLQLQYTIQYKVYRK